MSIATRRAFLAAGAATAGLLPTAAASLATRPDTTAPGRLRDRLAAAYRQHRDRVGDGPVVAEDIDGLVAACRVAIACWWAESPPVGVPINNHSWDDWRQHFGEDGRPVRYMTAACVLDVDGVDPGPQTVLLGSCRWFLDESPSPALDPEVRLCGGDPADRFAEAAAQQLTAVCRLIRADAALAMAVEVPKLYLHREASLLRMFAYTYALLRSEIS